VSDLISDSNKEDCVDSLDSEVATNYSHGELEKSWIVLLFMHELVLCLHATLIY